MTRARTLLVLGLLSLLFGAACDGCNGCGDDAVTDAADARVTELTSRLPASADAALVVPELGEAPKNLDTALRRLEAFWPEVRAMESRLNQGFGVELTNPESWESTGFDTEGSMVISMMESRPILAAYIDDENAFETHFIGRIRRLTDTPTPIESETIGEQKFRTSGNRPGIDMAWFYDDNIVILALPPLDALDVFEEGTANALAQKIAATDAESSLATHASFVDFREALVDDYPLSLYVNAERYLSRPEIAEQTNGLFGLDPFLSTLVEWSNANAQGVGVAMRTTDKQLEFRGYAGADDEMLAEAREAYSSEADVDWDGFLTANTVLSTRTGVDLPKAYEGYLNSLPEDDRRSLRRALSRIGRNYELDVEEDIIGALSGHSMLSFYGIGGDRERMARLLMGGRIGEGLRAVLSGAGLMINLHFDDAAKKDQLMERFSTMVGALVEQRPLRYDGDEQEGFEVIEPNDIDRFPGRIFSSADSLTFSTSAIGESSAFEYMTNSRDDEMLAGSADYPLGDRFATEDSLNGMYLNVPNLRSMMRGLPFVDGYAGVLRPLHEVMLTGGADDSGFYVDAVVGFTDPLEDEETQ